MTNLTQELADMNRANREKIPQSTLAIMDHATEELANAQMVARTLAEGATMPDFRLPNAVGKLVDLADLRASGPVVVSFYRGGWCPYCNLELHALQRELPSLQQAGATLVAISPEKPDESLSTSEKHGLEFEVLSDANNEFARQLGLVFTLSDDLQGVYQGFGVDIPGRTGMERWELPLPATYVVDKAGVVRFRFVDVDYTKRADPKDIIAALQALP